VTDIETSTGVYPVLATARWDGPDDGIPAPIPGFALSSFSPLVAHVAGRCLGRYGAPRPRTAVVLVSVHGDVATAAAVAQAVDGGRRVAPLLFFQSVPNSVAGHVAARWRLTGPVVCLSPIGEPMADGLAQARELIEDGDADAALVVVVTQGSVDGGRDTARAVLVGPATAGDEEESA
jgi:hypothetical protein